MTHAYPQKKILLLEDELLLAVDAAEQLNDAGYAVTVTSTLKRAQQVVEEHDFDLGIVDFNIGKNTSEEITKRLASKSVPVAIVSGANAKTLSQIMPDGVTIYTKPVDYTQVATQLLGQ